MTDDTLFDDHVDRPDPEVRRAVRRHVLGGVLHAVRQARGWSVNDASSAAGIAPMTWRRLEDGLDVRRRSLTALDSLLGQPFGTTARALDDDLAMVTLSGLAGDLYAGPVGTTDPAEYLDALAERFRSGTATLRSSARPAVTAATRHRSQRPDPVMMAALAAASTPLEKSNLVMAAEMIERLVREETEATENAAAALLAALPDLAAHTSGAFRAVAAAMLEHSGNKTLQRAAVEVLATADEVKAERS